MMTLNKARALAVEGIARLDGRPLDAVRLVDALTQCRRSGWIFFYESAAGAASSAPVVVTHDGDVHALGTALPLDQTVRAFERAQREQREQAVTR